jgi:DNA-binding transcriptional MerR regulator
MEEEIKKLRDAGFSDEDIRAYLEEQKSATSTAAPATGPVSPEQSAAEPVRASEIVPDYAPPPAPSMGETAATVGTAVAPYALPAAIGVGGGAGAYGLYKFGSKALDVGRSVVDQMNQRNVIEAAREQRIGRRVGLGGPTPPPPPPPAAPAAPPAPQQPGVIQRGMDYARQMQRIAAEKVMQGAQAAGQSMVNAGRAAGQGLATAGQAVAPYARAAAAPVAVGLTAALMPGNAGGAQMMVPQTGRLRGSDLNPMTGRPWTRQELDAYNANPNMIDSRLPPPVR